MATRELKIERDAEFDKDMKKLIKRFNTLEEDLNTFIKSALKAKYELDANINAFLPMEGRCNDIYDMMKVKKFACKSLKNKGSNSGIRIIFAYNKIEHKVNFVEIYFKADQVNESRDRIEKYINK